MYVLWDFTYILWNLVLDLPSVVLNGNAFLWFLPSHDISDLKVSKLCPLLKATHWTFSRKRSRKSKDIQKKIMESAFIHFSLFLTINVKPFLHRCSICSANQWTGFYMIGTSVMIELRKNVIFSYSGFLFKDLLTVFSRWISRRLAYLWCSLVRFFI